MRYLSLFAPSVVAIELMIIFLNETPRIVLISLGVDLILTGHCPAASVVMEASEGVFVTGSVHPAVDGLAVKIEGNGEIVTTVQTNGEGRYR